MFTDLDRKKQPTCSLFDNDRRTHDSVREMQIVHVNSDNDLKKIMQKLDSLFLKDESTSSYVVVIARCRVQYGKYFPSFSYFAIYFTRL